MADLSCSRINRKRSSFATKHFQWKSLKILDLHLSLRLVSFVARIITWKVRCWVTDTQTHRPSTITLAVHAHRGLTMALVNTTNELQSKHRGAAYTTTDCDLLANTGSQLTWWSRLANMLTIVSLKIGKFVLHMGLLYLTSIGLRLKWRCVCSYIQFTLWPSDDSWIEYIIPIYTLLSHYNRPNYDIVTL